MLTQAEIETYRKDGLVKPNFRFSVDMRQTLSQLTRTTLARTVGQRPESINCPHIDNWTEGLDADICNGWLAVAGHHDIVARVKSVIGDNIILWGGQFFCKPATDGMEVPWHQDGDYWPIRPLNTCTVWLAIDDADSGNGCMRYIPGSHQQQTIFPSFIDNRQDLVLNQVTSQEAIDVSIARDDQLQSGEFSLHDVYGADEAFITGTFAGLAPVREIDGRIIAHPLSRQAEWQGAGPVTRRLIRLYRDLCTAEARRP